MSSLRKEKKAFKRYWREMGWKIYRCTKDKLLLSSGRRWIVFHQTKMRKITSKRMKVSTIFGDL